MKCEICHRGPRDGVTLYRVNTKHQPGRWRCTEDTGIYAPAIDPEIQTIVDAINARGGDSA